MTRSGRAAAVLLTVLVALSACGGSPSATRGVRINRDVFGWSNQYKEDSNESILVKGTAPTASLIEALNRASDRFMRTDSDGVEHGLEEDADVYTDLPGAYTPNYVSTPKATLAGIELYVDCKGVIGPPMQARFVQILREELGSVGGGVTVSVDR